MTGAASTLAGPVRRRLGVGAIALLSMSACASIVGITDITGIDGGADGGDDALGSSDSSSGSPSSSDGPGSASGSGGDTGVRGGGSGSRNDDSGAGDSTAGSSGTGSSGTGSSGTGSSGTGSSGTGSSGAGSSGTGSSGTGSSGTGSSGTGSSGTGSSGTGSSGTGSSGTGTADSSAPAEVAGCGATTLYEADGSDTSVVGPWPVGVETVMVSMTGGSRPVEVWYPARLGSEAGISQVTYDWTSNLPAGQASKISASAKVLQHCNCYRNLPIDTSHGPYPAVIFLHGSGSFRTASLSQMTQWASRGFIAVAADHAGLYMGDFLGTQGSGCTPPSGVSYPSYNLETDVEAMISGMTTTSSGPFAFLGSSVDMTRIGLGGHSQGASAAATYASMANVQVDLPLADLGGTVPSGSALKSVLVASGASDSVVSFSSDTAAYSGATTNIKRLVGIANGDHFDVTDLCMDTNSSGQTFFGVASMYSVCGATVLASLAKCGTALTPPSLGPAITNYVTTAALEETLHCQDRSAAFSALQTKYSQVSTFTHSP
jgi:hypothetical protein